MKKVLLILGLMVSANAYSMSKGCNSNSVPCKIGKQAIAMMAATTSVSLGCVNLAVVQEDFDKQFKRWGVCPDPKAAVTDRAGVPTTICKTLVTFVLDAAVGGAIPAKWECNPTATVDMLKAALNSGCEKIFP